MSLLWFPPEGWRVRGHQGNSEFAVAAPEEEFLIILVSLNPQHTEKSGNETPARGGVIGLGVIAGKSARKSRCAGPRDVANFYPVGCHSETSGGVCPVRIQDRIAMMVLISIPTKPC